jgi:hypothetical protein
MEFLQNEIDFFRQVFNHARPIEILPKQGWPGPHRKLFVVFWLTSLEEEYTHG